MMLKRFIIGVTLSSAFAACAGKPCAIDPSFDAKTCATLTAMALPDTLPERSTNAYADDRGAAIMGFQIFFDARFSGPHNVRCATCHAPESSFDDRRPVARAIGVGTRNAPSTLYAAYQSRLFWDGRAEVLWAQPIGAMENPDEMGFTRLELAHRIGESYREPYETTFGPLPDLTALPPIGKPGDAAYDTLSETDRDAVDRVTVNIGKAIEAYLRKQASGRSAFDRYLAGEKTAMSATQQLGMLLFVKNGCAGCHSGPLLSDEGFHNLGVPSWEGVEHDPGRARGVVLERENKFSPSSEYADQRQDISVADATPADLGAFRTPSLRNVSITEPYMHNGRFETLGDAVDFHLQGGGQDKSTFMGEVDAQLIPRSISTADREAIVAFLAALEGEYAPKPWSDWPDRP